MKRIIAIPCAYVALLTFALPARAQGPDAAGAAGSTDASKAQNSLTAPKLVEFSEPVYPEAKKASGESASVALLLTIDVSGQVSNAEVSASAGAEFDQAALDAAKLLRFEPATREGKAIAARIAFRFDFKFVPAPKEEPAAPVAAPVAAAAPAAEPAAAANGAEEIVIDVEGERPPREPTMRTLTSEEISKIPGTNGDALRSLTNMPGVARPGSLDGLLVVRGSAPQDTQVFVDGTSALMAYHLGGLSSVIPSEMLERINFYPGNFGAQYGRGMGGIVDVGVRSPKSDRFHGLIQVDSIDGRFLVEGPLGKSTRVLLAGRRSWLDAWLGPALRANGVGVTAAPRYYDYQAMLEQDLSTSTKLRLFAFGASDRTELLLYEPNPSDPAVGGSARSVESFWRIQGRIDTRPNDDVRWTSTLSVGGEKQDQTVGDLFVDGRSLVLEGRSDVRAKIHPRLVAIAGIDVINYNYDVAVRFPPVDASSSESSGPLFGRPAQTLHAIANTIRPGAYAMLEATPLPGFKLFPGVRTDYNQDIRKFTVDPRLGVRLDLHRGFPRTTLKGGIGVFHQPPELFQSVKPYGTPNIGSNTAYHYSLGFEQEFLPPLELSVEGFYKDLRNLVAATPAADSSEAGQTYSNMGSGRTYGAEVLLRYKPFGRFFGWLAYTLSQSERRDGPGQPLHLFEYDQTHILTAIGSYKLGKGWQVGARFRYVSGKPYTPNVGGVMDYDAGVYAPVASSHENSSRMPAFQQLDLRVDKTWKFQSWSFSFYVDLQNAYAHKNVESIGDNYDFSKATYVYGIPFLPVLGLRGEL
jgi:TonB family protein